MGGRDVDREEGVPDTPVLATAVRTYLTWRYDDMGYAVKKNCLRREREMAVVETGGKRTMSNKPSAYPDVMKPHGLGSLSAGIDDAPPVAEGIADVALAVTPAASRPAYKSWAFPSISSRTACLRPERAATERAARDWGIDLRVSMLDLARTCVELVNQ